jgi:hypothetical protein
MEESFENTALAFQKDKGAHSFNMETRMVKIDEKLAQRTIFAV